MVLILEHWEQGGWIDRWVYVGARVKEVSFVSVIPGDWVVITASKHTSANWMASNGWHAWGDNRNAHLLSRIK